MSHHYRGRHVALWLDLIPKLHKPNMGDDELANRFDLSTFDEPGRLEDIDEILPFTVTPTPSTTITVAVNVTKPSKINARAPPHVTTTPVLTSPFASIPKQKASNIPFSDEKKGTSFPFNLTIAIGCSLLLFNIIVFAGIFYQRRKMNLLKAKREYSPAQAECPGTSRQTLSNSEEDKKLFESVNLLSKNDVEYSHAKHRCKDIKNCLKEHETIRLVSIEDLNEKIEPISMQHRGENCTTMRDGRYGYR